MPEPDHPMTYAEYRAIGVAAMEEWGDRIGSYEAYVDSVLTLLDGSEHVTLGAVLDAHAALHDTEERSGDG